MTPAEQVHFHIVKPRAAITTSFKTVSNSPGAEHAKDITPFVDTFRPPAGIFPREKPQRKRLRFFQMAADFLTHRVGRDNIVSAVVHMDERTPHMHLTFVPLTEDNRLSAKEILGNRASLSRWQDDFHAHMVEKYPDLERGESAFKTGRKHIPTRLFKQRFLSLLPEPLKRTGLYRAAESGKKKEEALALLKSGSADGEFQRRLKSTRSQFQLLVENKSWKPGQRPANQEVKGQKERGKLKLSFITILRLVGPYSRLIILNRCVRSREEKPIRKTIRL